MLAVGGTEKDNFYRMTGQELSTKMKYGYGEHEGEPRFVDSLVLKNAQNLLVVGWVPSIGDLFADDWEEIE